MKKYNLNQFEKFRPATDEEFQRAQAAIERYTEINTNTKKATRVIWLIAIVEILVFIYGIWKGEILLISLPGFFAVLALITLWVNADIKKKFKRQLQGLKRETIPVVISELYEEVKNSRGKRQIVALVKDEKGVQLESYSTASNQWKTAHVTMWTTLHKGDEALLFQSGDEMFVIGRNCDGNFKGEEGKFKDS